MAEPTVRMSGIVLSSLMFQHLNSDSDSEGLLLGESKFEEQVTINDSQAEHIHIEEIYNVQKHITCHKLQSFYNSVGDVDMEALQDVLADNKLDDVIGWYRQRRGTDQQMTFRERIIQENLKRSLCNPHVVFMLLTPGKLTSTGSTHRTEFAAFISRSRSFLNIPVLITNLGLLEQLAYWRVSTSCSAKGYNHAMKKHGSKFFSSNGPLREVSEINKMNDSLQEELQKSCREVEESERLMASLQSEVSALRRRVRESRQNKEREETQDNDRHNVRLRDALSALFARSPLFCTQTLTLDGCPVPDVHHNSQHNRDVSTVSPTQSERKTGRKRPRPLSVRRERKRRISDP